MRLCGVASVFCPWSSFENIIYLSHMEEQNPLEVVKQINKSKITQRHLALKITDLQIVQTQLTGVQSIRY